MALERFDRLDAAIDEAARRLTHAEPAGFLTPRVMARLREARPAPSRWLVATAGAVVLVAAAAAVAWLQLNRSATGDAPQSAQVRPPTPQPAAPIDRAQEAPAIPLRHTTTPVRSTRGGPAPQDAATQTMSPVEAAWRARAVPPLPEPAPIVLDGSQPEALVVPLLELKPITTSPVVLEPIGEGQH
jgi:hypothetical protein